MVELHQRLTIVNQSLTFHLKITSGGKVIYEGNDMHRISFIKGLLEFSQDCAQTVATVSNWHLDKGKH